MFGAAVAAAVGVIAFVPNEAVAANRSITIGTGNPAGVYFVTGNAICQLVHKEAAEGGKRDIRCAAPPTRGSTDNIDQISDGGFEFGVARSDWQYHAYSCTSKRVKCYRKLRSVFSVYPEPFQIIVREDSGINTWRDLKGKRVNIGKPGSGDRSIMELLMRAHGTLSSDFKMATELTSAARSRALCDGEIDAFGYVVGVPSAGVSAATDACSARIINLNGGVEKKLVYGYPYYAFATIPKGTYKTSHSDVTTFGVMVTFVTSEDVPEDIVYEVTHAVFENFDDFRKMHPVFGHLDPLRMVKDGLSAPLHPGALRFYKENGWIR